MATLGIWLFYAILLYGQYSKPNWIPDELMFIEKREKVVQMVEEDGLLHTYCYGPNIVGYGSSYWVGYALLSADEETALHQMRIIQLVLVLLLPLLLSLWAWRHGDLTALLATLMWYTIPLNWWLGKLTGPEIPSFFFVGLAIWLCLAYRHWRHTFWLAPLLMGIGISIKLNALPSALVLLWVGLPLLRSRHYARALAMPACLLMGVWLASPNILLHTDGYLAGLEKGQMGAAEMDFNFIDRMNTILYSTYVPWDGVSSWGLFKGVMMQVPLILWLVAMATGRRGRWLLLLTGAVLTVYALLYLNNPTFLGWYWLPLIPLLILAMQHTGALPRRWLYLLPVAALLIQAAEGGNLIGQSFAEKNLQNENVLHAAENTACLQQQLHKVIQTDSAREVEVLNFAEFAYPLEQKPLEVKGKIVRLRNAWDAYRWWANYDDFPKKGNPDLVIALGESRLLRLNRWEDATAQLNLVLKKRYNTPATLLRLPNCAQTQVYMIRPRATGPAARPPL